MNLLPNLCLGTAQIGMDYGITNKSGKIPEREVRKILCQAKQKGFVYIDTAQAYGDAEEILGKNLKDAEEFKLISKLPKQEKGGFTREDIKAWYETFSKSIDALQINSFDTYLIHSTEDLKKEGSEYLIEWMMDLKKENNIKKFGVSIYNSMELKGINTEMLDVVQVPISLYDQRLITNGTLDYLKKKNIEVHARSIYLQGLILQPSENWPRWIDGRTRKHHAKLEDLAKGM